MHVGPRAADCPATTPRPGDGRRPVALVLLVAIELQVWLDPYRPSPDFCGGWWSRARRGRWPCGGAGRSARCIVAVGARWARMRSVALKHRRRRGDDSWQGSCCPTAPGPFLAERRARAGACAGSRWPCPGRPDHDQHRRPICSSTWSSSRCCRGRWGGCCASARGSRACRTASGRAARRRARAARPDGGIRRARPDRARAARRDRAQRLGDGDPGRRRAAGDGPDPERGRGVAAASSSARAGRRWRRCAACSECSTAAAIRARSRRSRGLARSRRAARPHARGGARDRPASRWRAGTVSPALDLCAYRIVQEALTNAIKHAGPGPRDGPRALGDATRSSSRSPTTAAARRCQRRGSADTASPGMRERAALHGGTLDAGAGTGRRLRGARPPAARSGARRDERAARTARGHRPVRAWTRCWRSRSSLELELESGSAASASPPS